MKSYTIEQKITAFANQYRIHEVTSQDDKGTLVAFAHQKRLSFKEKIDFYSDESRKEVVFSVKAEKVMDVHGKFMVVSSAGETLGAIRKVFRQSLLRSTWEILAKNDVPVAMVTERSIQLAILRRVWNFVPFVGDLPFFFRYHFDFLVPGTEQVIGSYSKTTLLRDHYRLEVDDRLIEAVGWQTLVAQAVLLDALQGR